MCDSTAEGGRRCDARKDVKAQSQARANRRTRVRATERMGATVDAVLDETRTTREADRAWARHERFLRSIKATADTNPEIAQLRLDRLSGATLLSPERAWVREAMLANVQGAADAESIARVFNDEVPNEVDRKHFAVVLDAVVNSRAARPTAQAA